MALLLPQSEGGRRAGPLLLELLHQDAGRPRQAAAGPGLRGHQAVGALPAHTGRRAGTEGTGTAAFRHRRPR